MLQIISCISTYFRTVLKLSYCSIAVSTQESTNFIALMAMINMKIFTFLRFCFTNCTTTTLVLKKRFVNRFGYSVLSKNLFSSVFFEFIREFFFVSFIGIFRNMYPAISTPYMKSVWSTGVSYKIFYKFNVFAFTARFVFWIFSTISSSFPNGNIGSTFFTSTRFAI